MVTTGKVTAPILIPKFGRTLRGTDETHLWLWQKKLDCRKHQCHNGVVDHLGQTLNSSHASWCISGLKKECSIDIVNQSFRSCQDFSMLGKTAFSTWNVNKILQPGLLRLQIICHLQPFFLGYLCFCKPIFPKTWLATAKYLKPKQQWVTRWRTVQK